MLSKLFNNNTAFKIQRFVIYNLMRFPFLFCASYFMLKNQASPVNDFFKCYSFFLKVFFNLKINLNKKTWMSNVWKKNPHNLFYKKNYHKCIKNSLIFNFFWLTPEKTNTSIFFLVKCNYVLKTKNLNPNKHYSNIEKKEKKWKLIINLQKINCYITSKNILLFSFFFIFLNKITIDLFHNNSLQIFNLFILKYKNLNLLLDYNVRFI